MKVDREKRSRPDLTALIERLRAAREKTGRKAMLLSADYSTQHRNAVLAYDAANEIGLGIAIAHPAAPSGSSSAPVALPKTGRPSPPKGQAPPPPAQWGSAVLSNPLVSVPTLIGPTFMLQITAGERHLCDGPSRREILRIGGAGLLGLSLPSWLRAEPARRLEDQVGHPVLPRRGPRAPGPLGHEARRPASASGANSSRSRRPCRASMFCEHLPRLAAAGAPPDPRPLGPPHDRRPQRRRLLRADREGARWSAAGLITAPARRQLSPLRRRPGQAPADAAGTCPTSSTCPTG